MDEKLQKEIGEAIDLNRPKIIEERRKIIDDGKQYTIRIPKEFADSFGLDPEDHEFKFVLKFNEDGKHILQGEVVNKE